MTGAGHVAAVDLGASSGRVIVGRVGPSTLEALPIARFPNDPVTTVEGLHWNIVGLYDSVLRGLRDAFREISDIASVGVDTWGVDYALLRGDRMLGNPFHYRDARTADGVIAVHTIVPHGDLFVRNGLQFLPITTLYQLATEPAEVLSLADRMLMIPDLLGFWLTGEARAELTIASTTGLLHLPDRQWDAELLESLGLPSQVLPELIAPGQRLGALLPDVARTVGADASVPVTTVGSHDTASAVVAVPMNRASAAYISCGTWGLVGVEVDQPVLTPPALAANFTNEGGVDGRIRLLRNVMGLWILSGAVRAWERQDGQSLSLPDLLEAAAAVEAREVPLFDVDDARFLPPGDMPERIRMWCIEHGVRPPQHRPAVVRSIIESLARAFAEAVQTAGDLGGIRVQTIHIVGGGALNALLCQRTADISGIPVVAGPVEATALGNVLVQARAVGLIDGGLENLRDLVERTQPLRRFEPRH
ncbi:rhamnulokinase [Microcella alkaliphila]|uniref:Rhamnulokinase n=1 Tax=Microcella alkaliphila TaxID=279828 RepID=A0A0U5BKW5_9MICO|nr:rhamnulokinase family protein [Microcella alkaliphila]BAU31228.1 uncharacterized protein MalAC0309_0353 [Microcella alkaliphila]